MASYRNIVLIALIFLIATPLRTHGVSIGNDVAKVNVLGLLTCGVPGTPSSSGSQPLPGVLVNVTCNDGMVTLGQAVTDTVGFLNATFNVVDGLLFDNSKCVAEANVSGIANCSVFPPTGILRVSLVVVEIVQGVVLLVLGLILG